MSDIYQDDSNYRFINMIIKIHEDSSTVQPKDTCLTMHDQGSEMQDVVPHLQHHGTPNGAVLSNRDFEVQL